MADLQNPELPANGAAPPPDALAPTTLGPKRQRRPSVRLGDIGEQPASAIPHESYIRRCKQLKVPIPSHYPYHKESMAGIGKSSSKTRTLTNLVSDECHDAAALDAPASDEDRGMHHHHRAGGSDENLESMIGIRRGTRDGKMKRGGGPPVMRRVRSNWVSKVDEGMEGGEIKSSGGEDVGDEGNYREFDGLRREDSESPRKEHSHSDKRTARVGVSDSRDLAAADAVEVDAPSGTNDRNWDDGRCRLVEDGGVRSWLNGLGLGRYAPVFEIHEVDDEVLPLLTLEDLKDMGINAVGSRRKMYCAIQRLGKGFT